MPPKRKNYQKIKIIPLILQNRWIVLSVLFWFLFWVYVNTVPPTSFLSILGLFLILFSATLATTFIYTHKIKLNLILTLYLITIVFFAYLKQLNLINLTLITSLSVFLFYLFKK